MKSVNNMLDFGNSIVTYIANQANEIRGFLAIQIEEERIKASLMLKSDEWKQAITKIENHGYFKGQIGFILNFSGITDIFKQKGNLLWSEAEDQTFLDKFLEYSEKAAAIFNHSGLNKFDKYLFERALLCKGDYLLYTRMNYSFLIDYDRDIGWKRLLRDDNANRGYAKELFDSIGTSQIEIDLQKIVNESNVMDWRKYFIEYPEMIMACGSSKFIRFESSDDILLLETTRTNGYHREYFSYALAIKLRKAGEQVYYHKDNSVYYTKYISNTNGHDIKISFSTSQYVIEYNGTTTPLDSQEDVIDFLLKEDILTQ